DWDVGKSWIVGRGLEEDVSDHYGVACVLNQACENAFADDVSRVQIARSYEEVEKDYAADLSVSKFLLSQNVLPTKTSFATRVAALSALQDIFAKAFYPSPFHMTPVGSFTLGTDSPTSDLDIQCLGLIHRRDLFSVLRGTETEEREPFPFPEHCRLIRILADAKIPILELSIHGIHVDVQNASFPIPAAHSRIAFNLDTAIAETVFPAQTRAILASYTDAQLIQLAVPDACKSAFRLAARVLKVWARVKGMHLVKLGFPPSHALVVLFAGLFKRGDVSGTVTAGGLVAKFFRVWSALDWDVPEEWDLKARGTSAHRKEKDRMTVVAPSGSINICRNVVTSSRNVWVQELKRGYDLVCEVEAQGSEFGEDFLEKLCQEYPISNSTPPSSTFKRLESVSNNSKNSKRQSNANSSPFSSTSIKDARPLQFGHESTGNVILGLSKGGKSPTSPSEQKSAFAMLDNLLMNFEAQVMAEEFPVGMWVQALRVVKTGVANLVPVPVYDPASAPVEMPHPEPAAPQRVFERDLAAATGISSTISSKSKFRSSEDVFNRIMWDNRFDPDTFVIGCMERFTGIQEIPFTDFAARKADQQGEDWIPFHRVWYFKRVFVNVQSGESVVEVVWDRMSKSECIFTCSRVPPCFTSTLFLPSK
ncbi:hypothetical protein HDU77_000517, partial [Chytriomyces hyalinus]